MTTNGFLRHDEFFNLKILCVINYPMHELLVTEAHGGGLMRHVGIIKTLKVLH